MKYGTIKIAQAFLYEDTEAARGIYEGHEGKISDEVFYGWGVTVLKEEMGVLYVRTFYGYEGYISKKSVKSLRAKIPMTEVHILTAAYADILEAPKVQGKIMITLSRGSLITICDEEVTNGYLRVLLVDGRKGYIPAVLISEYTPNTHKHISETAFRDNIVRTAQSYLGVQYRWGGKSPSGIDCSGLTFMSYFINGVMIYRDAKLNKGYPIKEIDKTKLKKGDLIYFPGHIAIYIGNEKFIHSTGNEKSFACVYGSFRKEDIGYREDLKNSIKHYGSLFVR